MVKIRTLDEFVDYLIKENLSQNSIEQYIAQIKKFIRLGLFEYNDNEKLYGNINMFVSGHKTFSMYAIKHYMCFIGMGKVWKRYYERYGRHIKQKDRRVLKKSVSFEKLKLIKKEMSNPYDVILSVQYETGCRISAILTLTFEEIKLEDNGHLELSITEKGDHKRILVITDSQTINFILNKKKGKSLQDKVFSCSLNSYNRHLGRASKLVIGSRISSHYIRHSRGIQIFENTKDVTKVKELLGHRRLDTTYTYLKSSGVLAKDVILENKVSLND